MDDTTESSVSATRAAGQAQVSDRAESKNSISLTPPPSQSQSAHQKILSASPLPTSETLALSDERIHQAQPDELRTMVSSLMSSLQEAQSDAAHYKLQYRMLAIESAEAVERIQVEMNMAQREIEVLHNANNNNNQPVEPRIIQVQPEPDPNMRHIHVDMYHSMIQEIHELRSHNAHLENTVSHQKRMVVQQESEIATLNDRVSLLRERLRENRLHLNRYRRAAGFSSVQATPTSGRTREQPHFAALLHASDMLDERGGPMTPRTPTRRRAPSTTPTPRTPQTVQPRLSRNIYDTPPTSQSVRHLQIPQTAPPLRGSKFVPAFIPQAVVAAERGRDSEGTVSAAEDSEAETEVPEHSSDTAEGRTHVEEPRTPTRKASTNRLGLTQGRLFGHVRKGGFQPSEERAKEAEQASRNNPARPPQLQ